MSIAAAPAATGAAERGHAKAAADKKKCKKRGKSARKKCKRHRRNRDAQVPSVRPAPAPAQPAGEAPNLTPDSGACGPIPKGTGGHWECTFSDEFNGTSLDTDKWLPQRTATSGYMNGPTACFVDSPNNISVSGGTLKLTARKEPAPFDCGEGFMMQYTAGMVTSAQGRFSQTYGRFEIRAKIPSAQVRGLHTALWLWPVDSARYGQYPGSGEIDIAEMFSQYPDRAIPYIHYNAGPGANVTNTSCMISNLGFHTYTLEWSPSGLEIAYDGRTCLVHPLNPAAPQPFDQPFFIALTQALGVDTNAFHPDTTPLPATTDVDYVRVWK